MMVKMERSMMASGLRDSRMDTVSGKDQRATRTWVNGRHLKRMGTEVKCGPMAISMKVNGETA